MGKEIEVTIESTFPLSGTLMLPNGKEGKCPAVLIIAGSGNSDRDGNVKNINMNIYKDLADFLTSIGFATLRYDKRGINKSGGNFHNTGLNDLIEDAVHCLRFLKKHPEVDESRVLILGHSEGALIAPAVHDEERVAGLIMLAGGAEPSKDLLPRQNEMAYEEMYKAKGLKGWLFRTFKIPEKARKQNEKIFQKVMETDDEIIRVQGIKLNAKWLRETMNYNVCEYLEKVDCPVLSITGDKDIQVPPEHARLIAEMVKGEAEWHIIPDMNHILRKYDGEHTMLGLKKEYKALLDQPIDKELLQIIERWLMEKFK